MNIGGVGDQGSGPDPVSVCADWKTCAGGAEGRVCCESAAEESTVD